MERETVKKAGKEGWDVLITRSRPGIRVKQRQRERERTPRIEFLQ